MVSFLIALGTTLLVLGIMIVVHELGHHLVAKSFGVRVESFSVGFGRRLFGFQYGGTDYRLSLLPFGGYVKMAGENPLESRSGDAGEFMSHPRWQRILIALAGPSMNILLAVALLTGVYMVNYEHEAYLDKPAVVGYVENDTAGAKAGIEVGDRIIRFEGLENPVWEDVFLKAMLNARTPISVGIRRGDQILTKQITPEPRGQQEIGYLGLVPEQPLLVTAIEDTMPAYKAGLRVGDEIVAVNGESIRSMPAMQNYLKKNGDKEIAVRLLRDGKIDEFRVKPVQSDMGNGEKAFRIGFRSEPMHVDRLSFSQALKRSVEQNKKFSFLIMELLQKMVQRKVSIKQMEGPIGIGREAGRAIQQPGWTPLLLLMAAISLNLGVFNLLPIPILDGGLILLTLIESALRRDINQRLKERIYQTAFVFLVIFAVMVVYNDFSKLSFFSNYLP